MQPSLAEYRRKKKMQTKTNMLKVAVLPKIINPDQLETWYSRELMVELNKDAVENPAPRPLRLPLFEQGHARGYLDGWLKGIEQDEKYPQLRFLAIEAELEGQKVHASIEWEELALHFGLADVSHFWWRQAALADEPWAAWQSDLARLGLQDQAAFFGPQTIPDRKRCPGWSDPTLEITWMLWLAAWRFNNGVALQMGLRQEQLQEAFSALLKQIPELPAEILSRSQEMRGWTRDETRAFMQGTKS
jgi:hypothetical protein